MKNVRPRKTTLAKIRDQSALITIQVLTLLVLQKHLRSGGRRSTSCESTHLSGERTPRNSAPAQGHPATLPPKVKSRTSDDADEKVQVNDGVGQGGGRHRQSRHQAAHHDNSPASKAIYQYAADRTCRQEQREIFQKQHGRTKVGGTPQVPPLTLSCRFNMCEFTRFIPTCGSSSTTLKRGHS